MGRVVFFDLWMYGNSGGVLSGTYWGSTLICTDKMRTYGNFPKLGVPFWGVPIIRTIVYWGLYWGPLILGNYHIGLRFWGFEFRVSGCLTCRARLKI